MTLEEHAQRVIYQQSIQISALSVALDEARKELQAAQRQTPPVPQAPDMPETEDSHD